MIAADIADALLGKRGELVCLIDQLEKKLGQLRADLAHVDGTIKLFTPVQPAGVSESAPPKTRQRRQDWFRPRELARSVLDVLRQSERPLTALEIAVAIMTAKGQDASDRVWLEQVQKLVLCATANYARRQVIDRAGRSGRAVLWKVAE